MWHTPKQIWEHLNKPGRDYKIFTGSVTAALIHQQAVNTRAGTLRCSANAKTLLESVGKRLMESFLQIWVICSRGLLPFLVFSWSFGWRRQPFLGASAETSTLVLVSVAFVMSLTDAVTKYEIIALSKLTGPDICSKWRWILGSFDATEQKEFLLLRCWLHHQGYRIRISGIWQDKPANKKITCVFKSAGGF